MNTTTEILLVTDKRDGFSDLHSSIVSGENMEVRWAEYGNKALAMILEGSFGLVIADEQLMDMTGLEFLKQLVSMNPLINCVLVSPLPPKEFHEVTEGLGLVGQLPPNPDTQSVAGLMEKFRKINEMSPPLKNMGKIS
jgi:CheY-like chemotaxis protein